MRPKKRQRIDELLVASGMFPSKDAAQRAIFAGEVIADDKRMDSPSELANEDAKIRLKGKGRYVSRGGDKLKSAIDSFGIDVSGRRCLDIGSSSGGFTDCLIQEGARSVACVDVNYGQLSWKVRSDPRVVAFERTNIRTADPAAIGAPFDVVVIDVSFIGLGMLAGVIAQYCEEGSELVALVKPQFESKQGESVGGVIEDEAVRLRCLGEVEEALADNGFAVLGSIESPLRGPAGNIEFLVHASYERT